MVNVYKENPITGEKDIVHIQGEHIIANSIVLNNGTSSENVTDIQNLSDGNIYNLSEVTDVPGQNLEITFINVFKICALIAHMRYSGGNVNSHWVEDQLWNDVDSQWDTFFTFDTSSGLNYRFAEIPNDTKYINSNNETKRRIYHPSSGNNSHDSFIDYLALKPC